MIMDDDDEQVVVTLYHCDECGGTYSIHNDGTPGMPCYCLDRLRNAMRLEGRISDKKVPFMERGD